MFIGHFGLGFGAKPAAPAASLGTLFIASQFADLLWPALVLLGYEHVDVQPGATTMTPLNFVSYPYSHSLLTLCAWGVAFGALYFAIRRSRIAAAVTVALLVVSHWVLDYVTHRPDMPLTVNGPERLGLGLWNSIPGTLAVELAIFAIGLALYLRTTTPRDRIGRLVGPGRVPLGRLRRERRRPAAAERRRRGVVRAGDVVARHLGSWDRSAPDYRIELRT